MMEERRRRFEVQVLSHLDGAYRYARSLMRSRDDAEDVVQEAVLRAYRAFDSLRDEDAKAWFMTIVRNCHASAYKEERLRGYVSIPEDHDAQAGREWASMAASPESAAMQRDDQRALLRVLMTLPEEFRDVLVLREVADLDYRQISAVIGSPLGTVMSRLARARAALRKRGQELLGKSHAMP
jgi:RNA polymerase sigma factor (sigma-70 family)